MASAGEFWQAARAMSDAAPSSVSPPAPLRWPEDVVFSTLGDPVRRRLLVSLAASGPQAASQLAPRVSRRLDATLKHLQTLRAAGMVVMTPDPVDKRRQLYALAPAVSVSARPDGGRDLDFGCCLARLGG
jgi:DNA-binding transcriptional ArsR family regulator